MLATKQVHDYSNLSLQCTGPSQGTKPRVKFLDDTNATPSSSFEHTPTPVPCRDCTCSHPFQYFQRSKSSRRLKLLSYCLHFSLNSDCICTESNLHVSCTERYTGLVDFYIKCPPRQLCTAHMLAYTVTSKMAAFVTSQRKNAAIA